MTCILQFGCPVQWLYPPNVFVQSSMAADKCRFSLFRLQLEEQQRASPRCLSVGGPPESTIKTTLQTVGSYDVESSRNFHFFHWSVALRQINSFNIDCFLCFFQVFMCAQNVEMNCFWALRSFSTPLRGRPSQKLWDRTVCLSMPKPPPLWKCPVPNVAMDLVTSSWMTDQREANHASEYSHPLSPSKRRGKRMETRESQLWMGNKMITQRPTYIFRQFKIYELCFLCVHCLLWLVQLLLKL